MPQGSSQSRNGTERHGRRTSILIEDVIRQSAPRQVDREAGVIRDLKILGLQSDNGRTYTEEACRKALPMYESVRVNVDHPTDANGNPKPTRGRSSYDRFGRLVNVRFVKGDGIRGDLEFLKAHRLAECVAEACERMPEAFGLSHNAQGEGDERRGVFVVEEITEVRSVDLVAEPATTKSLLESKGRKPMAKNKVTKAVTEDDEIMDPGMDAGGGDMGGDHMDDLFSAFKKLAATDPEKANKVLSMLKAEVGGAGDDTGGDEEAALEGEDEGEKKKDDDEEETMEWSGRDSEGHGANSAKDGAGMYGRMRNEHEFKKSKAGRGPIESRQHKSGKGRSLSEERAKQYCRLAGIEPDKQLLEAIKSMPSTDAALSLLEWAKGKAGGRYTGPRSVSPGQGQGNGKAKAAADAKDFASIISRN